MGNNQMKPCPHCNGTGEIEITVGDRIREERKALGLTQQELAERLPVTRPQLANIEADRSSPTLPVLKALCENLEVTSDQLLFGSNNHG